MLGPFVWISVPQYLEWMTAWLVHFPVLLLVLDTAVGDLVTVGALVLRRLLAHMAGIHGGTADVQSKKRWFSAGENLVRTLIQLRDVHPPPHATLNSYKLGQLMNRAHTSHLLPCSTLGPLITIYRPPLLSGPMLCEAGHPNRNEIKTLIDFLLFVFVSGPH